MKRWSSGWIGGALLLTTTLVAAQGESSALAQSLFDEARALMTAGKYAEACPKLEESQHLDPGGGTLLNLASCHEKLGKTATAWVEYRDALSLARRDGRSDRAEEAEARILALEPTLCRLTIQVDAQNPADTQVFRNDQPVGRAAWGTSVPVDPGEQRIVARARAHREWATSVRLDGTAATESVKVPLLEALRVEKPEERPMPTPHSRNRLTKDHPVKTGSGQRVLSYSLVGVGVVGIFVGTYFGVRALGKKSDSDDICNSDACPGEKADAVELNDDARRFAWISNVSLGVGIVAGGIGTYLLLSEPKAQSTTALRIQPGPGRAGLSVMQSF